MKQIFLAIKEAQYAPVILLLFVAAIWMLPSYQSPPEPKRYSISYTEQEWGRKLNMLESAKEIMRSSTLPGNVIANWQDSLSLFQRDIQKQVGGQIAQDTVKTKK